MFRRIRASILALFCFVVLSVLLVGCKPRTSSVGEISDVFADDVHVFFDNSPHCIDVIGLRDGDSVLYSVNENGEFSSLRPSFIDAGVYPVYFIVSRSGCNDLYLSATLYISVRTLDGISSSDNTVEYDGLSHNIILDGTRYGDSVSFSLDGETFSSDLNITDIGTYTVFFCVTRGFSEYRGSAVLTVLPTVSGTYFNPSFGVIRISDFSSSDGQSVIYDTSGIGYFGDKPLSVFCDSITVDGIIYTRIDNDSSVFTLKVNGEPVLFFTETYVDVSVTFSSSAAVVSLGTKAFSFSGFNYCESINSSINNGLDCGMSSHTVSSDIDVVLSSRRVVTLDVPVSQYIYDGLPHALPGIENLLFEVNGVFVSSPPQYVDAGTYSVRVLYISADTVPVYGVSTLVILPSPDGVYYSVSDNVLILIEHTVALKNGISVPLSFTDGDWYVDGISLSQYTLLSSERLLVFSLDGEIVNIFIDCGVEYFRIDGTLIELLDEDFGSVFEFSVPREVVSVSINGVSLDPIPFPGRGLLFGFGVTDFPDAGGVIVVQLLAR